MQRRRRRSRSTRSGRRSAPAIAGPITSAAWRDTPISAFADPRLGSSTSSAEDAAEGGLEQAAAEAVQRDEADQDAELQVTRRVDDVRAAAIRRARDVGADQEQTSRVAI